MRKLLVSFILSTLCVFANAQSEQVRIVRTDGTTIIGALQSADGSAVTIKIAGVEMTIPMSEVQSIEECPNVAVRKNTVEAEVTAGTSDGLSDRYGDYIITDDNPEYPDSFTVQLGNQKFTMILVRGGSFNMGYDGWLSRKIDSRPVHRVDLSSYYLSKEFINKQVVVDYLSIDDSKMKVKKNGMCYFSWLKAKCVVDSICAKQGVPYRLLTEAEWEYAAIQPVHAVFTASDKMKYEWCFDLFGDYLWWRQENPTGPSTNKYGDHVARIFGDSPISRWTRFARDNSDWSLVRLAISADKIPTLNK